MRGLSFEQSRLLVWPTTPGEALGAGITADQLRGPRVERVFRGLYTLPERAVDTRVEAAVRAGGGGALACEVTALAHFGVAVPRALTGGGDIHVWVPPGRTGPTRAGIRVHRSRLQLPPVEWAGLTCVDPVECWLQTMERASLEDAVVLADGLMRRQDPLTSLADLTRIVEESHRRPGLRRARAVLELARERTDSPMETLLRLAIVGAGLPCPLVNYPVLGDRGRPVFWLDLAYPDALIAVEYDGGVHVEDTAQMERDATRRRRLEDQGWRILTATAADARTGFTAVLLSLKSALL